MPYKIAVVIDTLGNPESHRGAAKYFHHIFTNLAKLGVTVDIYCLNKKMDDKGALNQIFILTKEEKDRLESDFFKDKGYDFILTDTIESYSDILIKHSHSPIYRENFVRTPFENLVKKIFSKKRLLIADIEHFIIITMNAHKAIIANSKIAAEDYIKYCKVPPEKVHIIHPCINIEKEFSYRPQNIFTFGMNAMSFDMKGGFVFLNALYRLKAAKYDFQAKIIYPNYKKNIAIKLLMFLYGLKRNVSFLEIQEDMQSFYDSIDCIIIASKEETFGLVGLEAMANGKFVIAGTRCGIKDIIKNNENGFIFDYEKNPGKNLFKKLKFVIDNKNNLTEICQNAYLRAKEHSFENHAKSMLSVFKSIKQSAHS